MNQVGKMRDPIASYQSDWSTELGWTGWIGHFCSTWEQLLSAWVISKM